LEPIKKFTLGNNLQINGIAATSRSVPFRYTNLLATTMVNESNLNEGSGVNSDAITAFGITETLSGIKEALKTVFSFDVWETQIT
jgi:hypothetical protein